jgi:hypothetical protein
MLRRRRTHGLHPALRGPGGHRGRTGLAGQAAALPRHPQPAAGRRRRRDRAGRGRPGCGLAGAAQARRGEAADTRRVPAGLAVRREAYHPGAGPARAGLCRGQGGDGGRDPALPPPHLDPRAPLARPREPGVHPQRPDRAPPPRGGHLLGLHAAGRGAAEGAGGRHPGRGAEGARPHRDARGFREARTAGLRQGGDELPSR